MRAWQSGDDFSRGRIVGNITGQVAIIVASKKFSAKVASGRALEAASAASEVGSAAGVAEAAGETAAVAKEAQSVARVAKSAEAASRAAAVAKEAQSAASVAKGAEAVSKVASVAKETQSAAKVAKGAETVAKSTAGAAKSAETVAKSTVGVAKEAETVAKGTKAAGEAGAAAKEAKSAAGVAKGASVAREAENGAKSTLKPNLQLFARSPDVSTSIATNTGEVEILSRKGALREAKRDARVPYNAHPVSVESVDMRTAAFEGSHVVKDSSGKVIKVREYHYENIDGREIVIQDHSAGHVKGDQGSHFNVRPADNTRTGHVEGTQAHYPFHK